MAPELVQAQQDAGASVRIGKGGQAQRRGGTALLQRLAVFDGIVGNEVAAKVQDLGFRAGNATDQRLCREIPVRVDPENALAVERWRIEEFEWLNAACDVFADEFKLAGGKRSRLGNRAEQDGRVSVPDTRSAVGAGEIVKAETAGGVEGGMQLLPEAVGAGRRNQVSDQDLPGDGAHGAAQ